MSQVKCADCKKYEAAKVCYSCSTPICLDCTFVCRVALSTGAVGKSDTEFIKLCKHCDKQPRVELKKVGVSGDGCVIQ